MFTKALILVLLGSSLVVSSPVADPGVWDKFKELYNRVSLKIQGAYESGKNAVNDLYEQAKANAAYAKELGEDAAAYLNQQAVKAKDATLAEIDAINAATKAKIEEVKEAAKTRGKRFGYEVQKTINSITEAGQNQIAQAIESAKNTLNQEVHNVKEYYANKGAQKPQ